MFTHTGNDETSCDSAETPGDAFLTLLEHLVDFTDRLNPENCIVERCSPLAWKEEAERYEKGHINHVSDNGDDSADVEYVIA